MHIHVHACTHTCVHIRGVNQHDSALLYNSTIQWGQGAFMHRVCSLYFTCNCMDYYMFTNLRREHTYDNISFAPFNNADMSASPHTCPKNNHVWVDNHTHINTHKHTHTRTHTHTHRHTHTHTHTHTHFIHPVRCGQIEIL